MTQDRNQGTNDAEIINSLLAPLLLLAALVDIICATVCFRIPLKVVSPYLFVALTVLILVLILRMPLARILKPGVWTAFLFLFLLILFDLHTYWRACPLSDDVIPTADAWSYCSLGKYLWEDSRGVDAGMPLVDQYASHLKDTRFAAPGMLAFLSAYVRPGDPASATTLFIVICFVAMFFALFYFSTSLGLSRDISIAAGLLGAASGWLNDAVLVGNLDNVLFLPLFTGFIGAVVRFVMTAEAAWTVVLPMALCGSAAIYCYPEGFFVGMAIASPVLAAAAYQSRSRKKATVLAIGAAATLILALPYLPIAAHFILNQFATTHQTVRPGETYFPGLLHLSTFVPAAWGLGDEYQAQFSFRDWLVGGVLVVLLVMGCWHFRRRAWLIMACMLPLAALALWQVSIKYNYGVYKVLFISLFVFTPLTAGGLAKLAAAVRWKPRLLLFGGAMFTVVVVTFVRQEHNLMNMWRGYGCVATLRDLASLRFVARNKAIVVDISNDVFQLWSVYYLRDVNIILREPVSYLAMPHVRPFLARARNVDSLPVAGRLHEGPDADAIWSDGVFSLVSAAQAQIVDIANPNGLETLGGQRFAWIGPEPTVIRVSVPKDGSYLIRATAFIAGASIPGKPASMIAVQAGSETSTIAVDSKTPGIPIDLKKGENVIRLWGLDRPTLSKLPNGDTRTLLLGIQGMFIVPRSQ